MIVDQTGGVETTPRHLRWQPRLPLRRQPDELMVALSTHAQASSEHAGLPFHPGCPVCRQLRSLGAVEPSRLVPARFAAGAVALALLGAGGTPTAAWAQAPPVAGDGEGDSEGTADPDSHGDLVAPDADLGGGGSQQTLEGSAELPDGAPEPEVLDAPDEADAAPVPTAPSNEAVGSPPPPAPQQAPAPSSAPVPERATTVHGLADERRHKNRPLSGRKLGHGSSAGRPKQLRPLRETIPSTSRPSTGSQESEAQPAGAPTRAGAGEQRTGTHVVRPGETLWGIAAARLGGVNPSPGRVAAEVTRLWNANEGAIGTGDPDMLRVGTVLHLP